MLIDAIEFEIRNFAKGTAEQFIVPNTNDNYAMIARHRMTRDIHFIQMFDFEYARKERIPQFISFGEAFAAAIQENELVMDIDDVDEMVGAF